MKRRSDISFHGSNDWMTMPDYNALLHSNDFIAIVVEKLGRTPIDFIDKMNAVQQSRKSYRPLSAAGVLLLLHLKNDPNDSISEHGEFSFLLIKRSSKVQQPGDLSCPGGMMHHVIDPMLRPLVIGRILPVLQGKARHFALSKDHETFRIMTLFLTNAIRESWEEINLCPFNVQFLGPLPTYSLHLFKRIIFPLVGFVKKTGDFKPNSEVERIVDIPLNVFFDENHYGMVHIEASEPPGLRNHPPQEFPCLIYQDEEGRENILWGATFSIIMNFFKTVFDFKMPGAHTRRFIKKTLGADYLTGR
jgi:8-oxo-dGTP pyrophosphatase MutT (NUDIX family)